MKKISKEEVWDRLSETDEDRSNRELTEMIKEAQCEIAKLDLVRNIDVSKFKTTK